MASRSGAAWSFGVNFLKTIGIDQSGDARVLKAQLDLTAMSIRAARFTTPLWSACMALLCSDLLGLFGRQPPDRVILVPLLVTVAMSIAATAATQYLTIATAVLDAAATRIWFARLVFLQFSASAAWGLMPWLLWQPGDMVNHIFLIAAVIAVISGLVAARGNNMILFIASLAPVTLLTAARFATGDQVIDQAIAFVAPMFALQMWYTGRPVIVRLQDDVRLRFQVEDLARELEETRDDALRKRFEAEAANASKTAFLANMSHELRTPLNAILGFSEIISQECFGPVGNARYRDYAGDIHSSGAHLLSLINDLLDIAKIEAGRMEISPNPLDAKRTFGIALKLVGNKAAEKRQQLVIRVDENAPHLYADERALKQILINLVSNAVKFTPQGGRIEVSAGLARDGGFQIMVKDNGPGIPREKLDRIFTPFSQVDNRYDRQAGGTGLGLALVRGLAELHGGRAWLESGAGQGCAAYVVLPVKAPEVATVAA